MVEVQEGVGMRRGGEEGGGVERWGGQCGGGMADRRRVVVEEQLHSAGSAWSGLSEGERRDLR